MIKTTFTMISTALVLMSTPSSAQDGPFTGFYAGAEIGAANSSTKSTVRSANDAIATKKDKTNSADYGLFGGYGHTFDNRFYVGTELSLNVVGGKGKIVSLGDQNVRERVALDASLTARAGYMLTENTLVYGIAGASQRQAKYILPNATLRNPVANATVTGPTFGLGIATDCDYNLIGRIELEHTNFGKKSYVDGDPRGGLGRPTTRYEPAATRLSIGLAYAF